jgi:hypothetical protein
VRSIKDLKPAPAPPYQPAATQQRMWPAVGVAYAEGRASLLPTALWLSMASFMLRRKQSSDRQGMQLLDWTSATRRGGQLTMQQELCVVHDGDNFTPPLSKVDRFMIATMLWG